LKIRHLSLVLLFLTLIFAVGCNRKNNANRDDISVLVFITGFIAGSPTYEQMAEGANEFKEKNPNVNIKIYEAGMNQAEWEQQLAQIISESAFDFVIGSNPSLPEICSNLASLFPDVKFIITDAQYDGHAQIKTYHFAQDEQSLFLGYLAGLVTTSNMPYANAQKKIGFIAAQEYPLLTNQMVPAFLEGARLADPGIELDFRVIGNWRDANKAAEIANAMMSSGVDVFTAIAGGAAQGLLRTATERNAYVVWYNIDAYKSAPRAIVGCGMLEQKKLVIEILEDLKTGEMQFGICEVLGVREGYINFIFDNPSYQNLPADIRAKFETFMHSMVN